MLDELKKISLPDLVDLLSEYTEKYTRLLAEKRYTDEYDTAKEMIKLIQAEIETRKKGEQLKFNRDPFATEGDSGNQASA
jgi:hypothetical protein